MFENLSNRLTRTFKTLTGQGRLTESNIKDTLRDVRVALIEADVALPVVKIITKQVQEKCMGEEVINHLKPGQAFLKVVEKELIDIMGEKNEELNLQAQPPAVILMAGLQGSGKTTTVAKLARHLKEKCDKSVMVVSCDVYRPAAIKQLETLAAEVDVTFFPSDTKQKPVKIAKNAIETAKKEAIDVVLVDTAGRLHIDADMMTEIKQLHEATDPVETLFVVDAMTGQDAANTAKVFNDTLELTGVIITKIDGDARGGSALSIREITGKPIKFLGVGEKTTALEPFHPERVVSRILGMGDMLGLIEQVEDQVDKKKAKKLAKKIKKGKSFDLEDFRDQLQQINKMGGVANIMGKIPGMGALPDAAKSQANEDTFKRIQAIIGSMTAKERQFPQIIKGSRKRRIARGSGTEIPDVNRLLKQFTQMQKMMKKMSKKGGMAKMMRGMGGMMPGGNDGFPPMG